MRAVQSPSFHDVAVDAVNDAMEERDYNLTMLYVRTRSSLVAQ